ncbi:OLC1v1005907C1 [Oldenlandia corymbosa var. corymbosa]|uniref:OLC1v1005907C1 n=1 Tax=Oldenlandia corymbosa var. corymbosa TaxID=529605 RepID=A0AAV1DIP8_OLDCO|nr:OLC1v1005907C1 [Oldenlandia corymbosa var. corymbosa]
MASLGLSFHTENSILKQNSVTRSTDPTWVLHKFSVNNGISGRKDRSRKRLLKICAITGQQEGLVNEGKADSASDSGFTKEESSLIDALIGMQGRGRSASPKQLQEVERAVQVLENLGGVPDPTSSSLIEGRWQLMFTTRPGTASPIQRTFVGVDSFAVFQEVYLRTNDPRVSNIVKFSDSVGELKVEATATTKDGKRILFQFDRAAFAFKFLPFKVPYPVPFRLLGDEAKGWLDTTYLSQSGNVRISRGNKGTTFVLQKETDARQKFLSVVFSGVGVKEAIEEFISLNKKDSGAEMELIEGEWQMIWSSQVETDSWMENAANGLMGMQVEYPTSILNFPHIFLGFPALYYGIFDQKFLKFHITDRQTKWWNEVLSGHLSRLEILYDGHFCVSFS